MVAPDVLNVERRVLSGTYQIERKIAEGGMGVVYEASHVTLPMRFAIKLWSRPETDADDDVALERFRREAEVAASLVNPHVVRLHDYQIAADGTPYIVMELLEGEDLSRRLKRERRLTAAQVARLVSQIAVALDAAHALGVVHRDLKPANVFLHQQPEPDFVKVLDFGVSKMLDRSTITRSDLLVGTPTYMSPEQASGEEIVSPASDVFALGVIAYEMLTGTRPFSGTSIPNILYQILHADPMPVSTYFGPEARAVDAVMSRVLAKRPLERYASATSFAIALQQVLAPLAKNLAPTLPNAVSEDEHRTSVRIRVAAQLATAKEIETLRTRRGPLTLLVAACVAVAFGIVVGAVYRRSVRPSAAQGAPAVVAAPLAVPVTVQPVADAPVTAATPEPTSSAPPKPAVERKLRHGVRTAPTVHKAAPVAPVQEL